MPGGAGFLPSTVVLVISSLPSKLCSVWCRFHGWLVAFLVAQDYWTRAFKKLLLIFADPPQKKKHQTSLWRNPVLWPPFAHLIDKILGAHTGSCVHNMVTNDKNIRLQNSQFSKPLIKSRCPVGPGRWIGPKPSKSIQTWTRGKKLDASQNLLFKMVSQNAGNDDKFKKNPPEILDLIEPHQFQRTPYTYSRAFWERFHGDHRKLRSQVKSDKFLPTTSSVSSWNYTTNIQIIRISLTYVYESKIHL